MSLRSALAIFLFVLVLDDPGRAEAETVCGAEGPACAVPLGTYRAMLPNGAPPERGYPALMFFHGAGGSGAGTLGNSGMVSEFLARGWAILAPDGLPRPGSRFGPGWSFHPSRPQQRDEAAFTREVLADAAGRFDIDRDRVLLAGFSIGGSLVWYLACADPSLAAAYAPVAGAFWRPHPEMGACAGPVRLLHTPGWRDETVPLEGRPLRGGGILQGDVFHGLEILRGANGCTGLRADEYDTEGPFWRRWWTRCTPGSALELALHEGGHSVPAGWSALALDWFATALPPYAGN
jgi:polyhydroxybutyrate depolymerase